MAKSVVKPMNEEEVRALFEEAMFGVKEKLKAVPDDRFFATLEKAATDKEWEALIPTLLAIHKALYVSDISIPTGVSGGMKFDLAENTVSFISNTNQKMTIQSTTILSNMQKQKDVVTESHFQFI